MYLTDLISLFISIFVLNQGNKLNKCSKWIKKGSLYRWDHYTGGIIIQVALKNNLLGAGLGSGIASLLLAGNSGFMADRDLGTGHYL